jgi:hypothetical protein
MNKPLDLPDVTLRKSSGTALIVAHKKTGMETLVPSSRLNAWLLRQLRSELVSSKEKP